MHLPSKPCKNIYSFGLEMGDPIDTALSGWKKIVLECEVILCKDWFNL
jgi:hypothetical protein